LAKAALSVVASLRKLVPIAVSEAASTWAYWSGASGVVDLGPVLPAVAATPLRLPACGLSSSSPLKTRTMPQQPRASSTTRLPPITALRLLLRGAACGGPAKAWG
jgi:hypothetical protein